MADRTHNGAASEAQPRRRPRNRKAQIAVAAARAFSDRGDEFGPADPHHSALHDGVFDAEHLREPGTQHNALLSTEVTARGARGAFQFRELWLTY